VLEGEKHATVLDTPAAALRACDDIRAGKKYDSEPYGKEVLTPL
jgi:hypothetical protein